MQKQQTHVPTFLPLANRPQNLGKTIDDDASRLDSVAKVTGSAKFGRDVYLPGTLFVSFIRCPYGAGTLQSTDEDAARSVDGVLEVTLEERSGRYHGHTIGYLVAESKLAMARGLRALDARWTQEPVTTAIAPLDAPSAGNGAIDEADHVLEAVYTTPVQTHSPLETHGGAVDHRGDSATVYSSTQGTFAARDGMGEALGLENSKFEVICEYVGGGFGSKLNGPGKEGVLAGRISRKYGRPAYCFVSRAEDHLDTGNRPSCRVHVRIGYNNDGTITGGRVRTWGGVGVARGGGGVRFPSDRYNLGAVDKEHADVQFNAGAPRPFRAPGCPQGAFVEELMLDEIATRAGIDPVELRRRLDTDGDRREMYLLGAELIGWSKRRPTGSQTGPIRRGFGVGSASWGRFPSQSEIDVLVHRDGSVEVRSGTQDIGTGQRTMLGVVAADAIGIPLRLVNVQIGRSSLPPGPASGGSVTTHNTAPAARSAGEDARNQLLDHLAGLIGAPAQDLEVVDGRILQQGKEIMSWAEACGRIRGDFIIGRGRWDRARRAADPTDGHSHGVQFAEVHVDTETGVIHVDRIVAIQACGRVVCRKTAESQIIGGVTQGVSYALFENRILDRNVGAMVNPNLEMYKIIGTVDMPHIEPVLWTKNQTGERSLGEPPTIPTAGAIACAVYNAIGSPVRDLPLTPDRVLAALEGGAA